MIERAAAQLEPDSCSGCGACCLHVGHPMFRTHIDTLPAEPAWDNLPQELKDERDAYMSDTGGDDYGQPCYWLDHATRQCKHYDHRPQCCRDFQLGGDDCLRLRKIGGIDP